MTKILDTFLFTHEFDLLELRLRLLWPVVDKFLMMEGDHSFTNQTKPMRFNEQKERFEWAAEKLMHVQHIGKFMDGGGDLYVEHQHRQCLYDYAKLMDFAPKDILMMSDVDEIPSRDVVAQFRKCPDFPQPFLLHQEFYYYNIKCHRGSKWRGTMAMHFGHDLGDVGEARQHRAKMKSTDKNCGWHLAHFYDSDSIKEKLSYSSHRGYNNPKYYDKGHLKKCVEQNINYLGKGNGDKQPEPLPEYLLEEMKRFPLMMGEEWR